MRGMQSWVGLPWVSRGTFLASVWTHHPGFGVWLPLGMNKVRLAGWQFSEPAGVQRHRSGGLGCLEYVLVDPWGPDSQPLLGVVSAGPFGVGTQPGYFRTSQSPGSTSVPTHEALLSLVTEEPCYLPRAHPAGLFRHQGGQHPSPSPSPWLSKGFWVILSPSPHPLGRPMQWSHQPPASQSCSKLIM